MVDASEHLQRHIGAANLLTWHGGRLVWRLGQQRLDEGPQQRVERHTQWRRRVLVVGL